MKTKHNTNSHPMKNIFLLLLLFTGMAKAQVVSIPDANFKAKLLAADTTNTIAEGWLGNYIKIDSNSDGEIQNSEAMTVARLNISSAGITDLTGISSFLALRLLDCSNNAMATVDFSANNNLSSLICSYNLLTQLDLVTGLSFLGYVDCSHNLLTSLNVQNAPVLKGLDCSFNQLTSLDFSGITDFPSCLVNDNLLTNLTFEYLTYISFFNISNNQFQDLDLSKVFLTVDDLLSHLIVLTGNPLRSINIKNGISEGMILYDALNDINTWEFICADDNEVATVTLSQPTVVVNTYCSFTPGGNYNTITGNIKFDANNTGCDATDLSQPNIRVNIDDGDDTGASFSSSTGNYTFFTQAGSFDITPSIENAPWFTFSPTTATVNFADNNNNIATQDFCISANGFHPDVEVVISPVLFARPGFDATYQITFRNKGNQAVSGTVNLIFDDSRTDFVSANPSVDNLAVNSLSWNYSNLLPFETRVITVVLNVNSPTETPAVNIDDILNFETSISPVDTDENPLDNTFLYNQTVVGSYDPNDITCLEGAVVPPSEIGNYLHYVINFENTGTFPAENVVVKTEIDAAKFDIGSLQLMNSNFAVDARITENKVEFIFENIQLPIGGHGHVLLKVETQDTLVTGDAVANRGDIYFDYNFPIDTGLANTVFQTLSNSIFEIDNSVAVYPNPATIQVNIKSDSLIQTIQIFDVQGRILQTKISNEKQTTFDLTRNEKGIYFFKIITDRGIKIEKIIKE